jgi:succinate-semialdehyde dehydrogenase/glutarate-semialdehyde dehydrogenase
MREAAVGDAAEAGIAIGPLIDERQLQKVCDLVNDAVAKGAHCLTGGHRLGRAGFFYAPTVLRNIPDDAAIRTEEIFGPVAPIYQFDSEEEVLAAANATEHGLASYVFTRDLSRALRMADDLDTGMTGINRGVVSNPVAPFGGVKASGIGREVASKVWMLISRPSTPESTSESSDAPQ